MSRWLRGGMVLLALCCPAFASASAPTPEGIAAIQKLLGFDVLIDLVFQKQFDENETLRMLAPEQRVCLSGHLRADMRAAMSKSMGDMFVDQQTVDDWKGFSLTSGGGKFLGTMRATVAAKAAGQPGPDVDAVMTAMHPTEKAEVIQFLDSPAAHVLTKEFPEIPAPENAAMARQFALCGMVPKTP